MPECFGSDGVGNPSTVASTTATVGMDSMQTIELIGTLLVTRKSERIFRKNFRR